MKPSMLCKAVVRTLSLWLLLSRPLAAGINDFDVVTLTNGDIFNGTVAQDVFTLKTKHGTVRIPHHMMRYLRLGSPATIRS